MAKQSATHIWKSEKEKLYCDECIAGSLKMFGVEQIEEYQSTPDVQIYCDQCGIRGLMRWKHSPLSFERGEPIMYIPASATTTSPHFRGIFLEVMDDSFARVISSQLGRITTAHLVTIYRYLEFVGMSDGCSYCKHFEDAVSAKVCQRGASMKFVCCGETE